MIPTPLEISLSVIIIILFVVFDFMRCQMQRRIRQLEESLRQKESEAYLLRNEKDSIIRRYLRQKYEKE